MVAITSSRISRGRFATKTRTGFIESSAQVEYRENDAAMAGSIRNQRMTGVLRYRAGLYRGINTWYFGELTNDHTYAAEYPSRLVLGPARCNWHASNTLRRSA